MNDPASPFEARLAARLGRRRLQRTLILAAAMIVGGAVSAASFARLVEALVTRPDGPAAAMALGAAVLLATTAAAAARGLGKR